MNEMELRKWAGQEVDWRGRQIVAEYSGSDPKSVVSGTIEEAELDVVYRVDQVPRSNVIIATMHLPTERDNHQGIPDNLYGLR